MESSQVTKQDTHSLCCSSKEPVKHTWDKEAVKPMRSCLPCSGCRCYDHEPEEHWQSAKVGREHDGNDTAGADHELVP